MWLKRNNETYCRWVSRSHYWVARHRPQTFLLTKDTHTAVVNLQNSCFLCRSAMSNLPFIHLTEHQHWPYVPLLSASACVPCLWVVREGLSVVLHQQCFKSLLQATASAFKYSYLTHPSWDLEKSDGWATLQHRAIFLRSHLARQLHIAEDTMKTLTVSCVLAMWLVAAFAWTSDSRVVARSLPDKELNGYISDHSRRDVVGTFLTISSCPATAKHFIPTS